MPRYPEANGLIFTDGQRALAAEIWEPEDDDDRRTIDINVFLNYRTDNEEFLYFRLTPEQARVVAAHLARLADLFGEAPDAAPDEA